MSNIAIKNIWEWIKAIVAKLFHRPGRETSTEPEPAPHVDKALKRKLAKRIQKRAVKTVDTSEGGPNMPKYQPCPRGCGWKKRTRKMMGGAYYKCRKHNEFFVRAPRL